MTSDVEKSIEIRYISGFPSLSAFIASDPDHSTAIFKRFDRLSARNLLYLQSELAELQARQDALDREDQKAAQTDSWREVKENARDWNAFVASAADDGSERAKAQMDLVEQIRVKLKEYHEAVLMQSAILSLRKPSKQSHHAFRQKFWNVADGIEHHPTLKSNSAGLYEEREDLVALKRPQEEDRLTMFLRKHCSLLFITHQPGSGSSLAYFSEYRITLVVGFTNIVIAAAFLFGAIYNLYYVKRDQVKLALIAGYTTAFALSIGLVTKAKRSEIFAACAAYAAVLVVFVSGNLNPKGANPTGAG